MNMQAKNQTSRAVTEVATGMFILKYLSLNFCD